MHLTQHSGSAVLLPCRLHSADPIHPVHWQKCHKTGAESSPWWSEWSSALSQATYYRNYSQSCPFHPVLPLYIGLWQKQASIPGVPAFHTPSHVVCTIRCVTWCCCQYGHHCYMLNQSIRHQHHINNTSYQYLNLSLVSYICKVPSLIAGCTIATVINLCINLISLTF